MFGFCRRYDGRDTNERGQRRERGQREQAENNSSSTEDIAAFATETTKFRVAEFSVANLTLLTSYLDSNTGRHFVVAGWVLKLQNHSTTLRRL